MEFIDHDITGVPINRVANYTVNVVANTIELYQDGKLVKSAVLEGTPEFNGENMYVMQPSSINGFVSNVIYYPTYLSMDDINNNFIYLDFNGIKDVAFDVHIINLLDAYFKNKGNIYIVDY